MGLLFRAGCVAVPVGLLSACTFLTDFDALEGALVDADAFPDATSPGPGRSDADSIDAADALDAAAPDVVSTDGAPGAFCTAPSTPTSFCESFDDGNPLGFGWDDGPALSGGGNFVKTDLEAGAPSPPGALQATLPVRSSNCFQYALLGKTLTLTNATKLHVSFMARLDSADDTTDFTFVEFSAHAAMGPENWDLGLQATTSSMIERETWTTSAGQQFANGSNAFSRWLAPGKWTSVAMDIDFATAHVDVSLDGNTAVSMGSTVVTNPFSPASVDISIGATTGRCGAAVDISFDNVRFSVE